MDRLNHVRREVKAMLVSCAISGLTATELVIFYRENNPTEFPLHDFPGCPDIDLFLNVYCSDIGYCTNNRWFPLPDPANPILQQILQAYGLVAAPAG